MGSKSSLTAPYPKPPSLTTQPPNQVATCLFWAAVLGITFPLILNAFTATGAFCFYAGLNVIAFILIFLFVPETKQRTLEELDYIFGVPGKRFISYQMREALPWWWKRWVLFKKGAKLRPLYQFEGGIEGGTEMKDGGNGVNGTNQVKDGVILTDDMNGAGKY
jgi:hypothetical protein